SNNSSNVSPIEKIAARIKTDPTDVSSKTVSIENSSSNNSNVTLNEEVAVRIKTEPNDSSSEIVSIQNISNNSSNISPHEEIIARIKTEPKDLSSETKSKQNSSNNNSNILPNEFIAARIKSEPKDSSSDQVSIQNSSNNNSNEMLNEDMDARIKLEPKDSSSETVSQQNSSNNNSDVSPNADKIARIKTVSIQNSSNNNSTVSPNEEIVSRIKTEPKDSLTETVSIQNSSNNYCNVLLNKEVDPRIKTEPKKNLSEMVVIQNLPNNINSISSLSPSIISNMTSSKDPGNSLDKSPNMLNNVISEAMTEPGSINNRYNSESAINELTIRIKEEPEDLDLYPESVGMQNNIESDLMPDSLHNTSNQKHVNEVITGIKIEPGDSTSSVDNAELSRKEINSVGTSNIKVESVDSVSISNLEQNLMSIKSDPGEASFKTVTNTEKQPKTGSSKGADAIHERLSMHESQSEIKQESIELNKVEESANNQLCNAVEINKDVKSLLITNSDDTAEVKKENITNLNSCNEVEVKNFFCNILNGIVIGDTDSDYDIVKNYNADLVPLSCNKFALIANIEDQKRSTTVGEKRYVIVNGTAIQCSKIDVPMKIQFDGIYSKKGSDLKVIIMWTGIKPKSFNKTGLLNEYDEIIEYWDVEGKYRGDFDKNVNIYTHLNEFDLNLQSKTFDNKFLNSNSFIIPYNVSVNLYLIKKTQHNSEPIWTISWLILDLTKMQSKTTVIQQLGSEKVCRPLTIPDELHSYKNNMKCDSLDKHEASAEGNSSSNIFSDRTKASCSKKDNVSVEPTSSTLYCLRAKCKFIVTDTSREPHIYLKNWQGCLVPQKKCGSLICYMVKMTVVGKYYTSYIDCNDSYIKDGTFIKCCESQIGGGILVQFDAFYHSNEERYVILAMWVGEKKHFVNTLSSHPTWIDSSATYCLGKRSTEYYLDLPTTLEKTHKVQLTEFKDSLGEKMDAPMRNVLPVQVYLNNRIKNEDDEFCAIIIVEKSIIESHTYELKQGENGINDNNKGKRIFKHKKGSIKTITRKKGIVKIQMNVSYLPQVASFTFEMLYVNGFQVTSFIPKDSIEEYLKKNKYLDSPWNCTVEQKGGADSKLITVELMWLGKKPVNHPAFQICTQQRQRK
ncbi:unnamed protein product, partial [Meganyctiphanes norvegica]